MKFRPACAAVALIVTSLLLLSGIRCTESAEIKIVSPGAYKDREGEGGGFGGPFPPFRIQQVWPAEDFAALGNKPHWLVDITFRPDQTLKNPLTAVFPDQQIRFATMPVGPPNLSLRFEDNLGSNVKLFYRGPWTLVADIDDTSPVPREFYDAEFPAGVTPYLYDPSKGNLLLDGIGWGGASAQSSDRVPGIRTELSGSPDGTHGVRSVAHVNQFTFIPVTAGDYNRDGTVDAADYVVWRKGLGTTYTQADYDVWRANFGQTIGSGGALPSAEPLPAIPEPSTALVLFVGSLALAARWRRTHVRQRRF
jgi:hypothetical protein